MLATSSVGQKTKHFVPKKRKESSTKANSSANNRNSSATKKRPPLKPNLKGSKAVSKTKSSKTNNADGGQRRTSINTNPFKPPKAPKGGKWNSQ